VTSAADAERAAAEAEAAAHARKTSPRADLWQSLGWIALGIATTIGSLRMDRLEKQDINPYTVPSAAFWKLGQSKPGDIYRFKSVSVDEAQALRRQLNETCSPASIA